MRAAMTSRLSIVTGGPGTGKTATIRMICAAATAQEATVLLVKHRLRLLEVPVTMREREHGSSSITFLRSVYYAFKVTLALLVAMARRYAVPSEEAHR